MSRSGPWALLPVLGKTTGHGDPQPGDRGRTEPGARDSLRLARSGRQQVSCALLSAPGGDRHQVGGGREAGAPGCPREPALPARRSAPPAWPGRTPGRRRSEVSLGNRRPPRMDGWISVAPGDPLPWAFVFSLLINIGVSLKLSVDRMWCKSRT